MARRLQTALRTWAGLFENFKRMCLLKWWDRKLRPCQEGTKWWRAPGLLRWRLLHQHCGGSWGTNPRRVTTGLVGLRELWKVVTVLRERALGSGLLTSYHLDGRESSQPSCGHEVLRPAASLFLGGTIHHAGVSVLSLAADWLLHIMVILKIGWTALYCRALGRWPSRQFMCLWKKAVKLYKFKIWEIHDIGCLIE